MQRERGSLDSKVGCMLVHVLRTEKLGEQEHEVLFPCTENDIIMMMI